MSFMLDAYLGYCDENRTAQEVGRPGRRDHPDMFPRPTEISHFASRVLCWVAE